MIWQNIIDAASGVVAALFLFVIIFYGLRSRAMNKSYFQKRWLRLEEKCSNQKTWHLAVIDADNLLNEALKKRHYRGKSTAERLVSAQRHLSSNHSVWFGHKLRNKIDEGSLKRLSKKDTRTALAGFHKALKDLGALASSAKVKGNKQ